MLSLSFGISNLKNKCRLCDEVATARYSGAGDDDGFYCSDHVNQIIDEVFKKWR